MTKYERIRHLRKNILKLNQEEFSTRINLSRSNLGNIEIGRISVTDRVITDICREYNINEQWLENGTEPIFIDDNTVVINEIIDLYKILNEDNRKYLKGYMDRLLQEQELSSMKK